MNSKSPWASKTVWGGVMLAVAMILEQFGVTLDDPEAASENIVQGITLLVELVGIVLVFIGRFTATKRIRLGGGTRALALLLVPVVMVGCKSSPGGYDMDEPLGQYDTAQEAFIQTVRTLNVGRQTGLFDDEEWATIVELIQEGDQILDEMEAAASADDSSVQTLYLETFQSILRRLVVWSIRVSNEEVSYGPQDRSDPRTVGLVRPGACDPSPQGQWPPARPEVPGGAEAASQAPGRAVGRVAGHAGRRPAGGYAFGLDPAAGPDRSAVAVLRRVGGQWRIAG